jgi:hypothetical protein
MMIQIVGDSPEARRGREEISRLTWKAQRYDELRLAIHALASRWERGVVVTASCVHSNDHGGPITYCCEDFGEGTPNELIDAIIRAAAQPAPATPFRVDDDFERAPDSLGAEWLVATARVGIVEQKPAPAAPSEGGDA